MSRSTRDAVAFGLGFLAGALLLAMLLGLQVRVSRAQAERFRTEAEAERQQVLKAMRIAELRVQQSVNVAEQARSQAAEKKD